MHTLRFHYTGEDFLEAVEPTLTQHEALYSLPYGLARRFAEESLRPSNDGDPAPPPSVDPSDDAHLLTVWDGADMDLAAWHTPPHAFSVSGGSNAGLATLAEWMKSRGALPNELYGPEASIETLVKALRREAAQVMGLALFELAEVRSPSGPSEIKLVTADPASPADRSLVQDWTHRFAVDCGLADEMEEVEKELPHLESGRVYLAHDVSGRPVSMVALTRTTPRTANISYVYTPDEERGKGYASALVAAVSQRLLESGKERCTLYTDLANPTSNRIYQALGYEQIATFSRVRIT